MEEKDDNYSFYALFIIFPIIIALIIFIQKKEIAKQERILHAWQLEMARNGVKTLYFKLGREIYSTGEHGGAWRKLIKLYINGKIANPDTLYNRNRILTKHCGEYYFNGDGINDSIIWKFPPINEYLRYDSKSHKFSIGVGSPRSISHKDKLPKCWDD